MDDLSNANDLSVAGPGSPISLDKYLKREHIPSEKFTILVDNTGLGIHKDSNEVLYITPDECQKQSEYYLHNHFDGIKIPIYLYRYLYIAYGLEDKYPIAGRVPTKEEVVAASKEGTINEKSENYIFVLNIIKWCFTNQEAGQLVGLIQLFSGALAKAKKENISIKVYIENPETNLHPQRCARLMSVLEQIRLDYL